MYKMGRLITDRDREIYKLRTSQRWSFEKIGEKYGISSGWTAYLFHRAKRNLDMTLRGFPDDTPVRIYNALARSGYKSFDELRPLSKLDLYAIRGLGQSSVEWLLARLNETKESKQPHMTLTEAKEYVKAHFPCMKTFEEDGYCALIRLRHKAEALPEMDCCGNMRDDSEWAYYDGVGKIGTGSYGEFYYFGKRGAQ